MKILVWSKNPSKIKAIENASKKCVYFKEEISIEGKEVASGISDMPLSLEETLEWAINRAKNCKANDWDHDFFVWMEWGTTIFRGKAFLVGVICIIDKKWELHIWISPLLETPQKWQEELYINKIDLWYLTDRETKKSDTGKKDGAMWALSDNMITRSDMFEQAFFCAIAPFYNQYYK
jgi:inosine/xanthosine triphosphatase